MVCEQHEHRILGVAIGLQPLTQAADKGVRLHGLRHGAGVLLLLRLGRVRHGAVVDHRAGTVQMGLRDVLLLRSVRPVAGIRDDEAEKRLVRDDLVISVEHLRIQHIAVHIEYRGIVVRLVAEVQVDLSAVINVRVGRVIGPGAVARVTKQVRQRIRQRMLGVIRVAHLILRRDHAGIRGKLRVERCRREKDRRVVIPEIHALLLQTV